MSADGCGNPIKSDQIQVNRTKKMMKMSVVSGPWSVAGDRILCGAMLRARWAMGIKLNQGKSRLLKINQGTKCVGASRFATLDAFETTRHVLNRNTGQGWWQRHSRPVHPQAGMPALPGSVKIRPFAGGGKGASGSGNARRVKFY